VILMVLALAALVLAAIPASLFWANLRAYRPPPPPSSSGLPPRVSVLIPARDEERSIRDAVEAALASESVEVEVLVLDDHSEDATGATVRQLAERDPRVRLLAGPELPDGWCGKQYACWILTSHASYDLLLFLDADVRLASNGLARMTAFLQQSGADLVSGIPCQETRTLLEQLVIPLIHFVLLGFLPIGRMRASGAPAYGAGCGQFFLARQSSYENAGGHSAIRDTLHDGLRLPRSFRAAGLRTDLCDATEIACCRMYRSGRDLWYGLSKNATEGLGTPGLIVPSTLVLFLGQVLPVLLLGLSIWLAPVAVFPAMVATICSYYPRLAGIRRFRQPVLGALLHPIGVFILLAIQWYAFVALILGRPRGWKGREYGNGQDQPAKGSVRLVSFCGGNERQENP
jgi:hypothetical protein